MTAAETVRAAVVDAINQQHPILGRNEPRPINQPFAQWVEPTHHLGLSGVIDLDALAQFVIDQLGAAARGASVRADVAALAVVLDDGRSPVVEGINTPNAVRRVGEAVELEFTDTTLRVLGTQAVWEPVSAEEELDDPFPSPTDPEPASDRPGVICQHCGQTIVPAAGIGGGWRHVASGFLNCGPTHETPAEP